jgi:N-acyl-D-amino-acid deacylase
VSVTDSALHDLVIRDVVLVDGEGGDGRAASLAIDGDRISVIADGDPYGELAGRRAIDGEGMVVAPGFIDAHVHTDVILLQDRQHSASLTQGVTTHVIGQDGLSYAPLSPDNLRRYKPYLSAVNGDPDIAWDWSSVAQFRARFDGTVAMNTAYLVPHGALRFEVLGMSDSPLVGTALDTACRLLDEAFEQGAVGLSTGLSYFPASYADTAELIALCRVAARHGRPYVTHVRSVFPHGHVDPLAEAVEIAERSGVALHVSHHRTSVSTVGQVDRVMAPLDRAHEQGLQVSFDMYPYLYGSGPLYIGLPPWAFAGDLDETLSRLADPGQRARLVAGIEENAVQIEGRFVHVPHHPDYVGRSIADVAAERGQSVPELTCNLLLEERLEVTFHQGRREVLEDQALQRRFEHDVFDLLDRPFAMVGSDGIYVGKLPHERGFGTFPKLVRLAREHRFPLGALVNRMSTVAAQRFRLEDRGVLRQGAVADLVLFDPATTRERATADWPRRGPEGIHTVVVNGEVALDAGMPTGLFAGRAVPTS